MFRAGGEIVSVPATWAPWTIHSIHAVWEEGKAIVLWWDDGYSMTSLGTYTIPSLAVGGKIWVGSDSSGGSQMDGFFSQIEVRSRYRAPRRGPAYFASLRSSLSPEEGFWRRLPPVYWMLDLSPRAGATVLARSVPGSRPVVVEQPFGRGRAMIIGTDELWRWRRGAGDRYLYRLWSQLARYLGSKRLAPGAAQLEVTLAPLGAAETGDHPPWRRVRATAYLEEAPGMPVRDAVVEGRLEAAAGAGDAAGGSGETRAAGAARVAFRRAGGLDGLYRAEFRPPGPGEYVLAIDRVVGKPSARFTVPEETLEEASCGRDRAALERLCRETGGALLADFEEGLARRLEELFPPREERGQREVARPLWSSWWLLSVLAGSFSLEWLLRKLWRLL